MFIRMFMIMNLLNSNRWVNWAGMASMAFVSVGCARQVEKRPNIVMIMTDDHTIQAMSCYGSKLVHTPNLDRLAREGMRFDHCYVSNAISGPSRACILTGKLSHMNGFTDNSKTFDGNQMTFPKLLKADGYQTAMVGKWHLNSAPQGFDFWSVLIGQGEYYQPKFIENGKEITESGYVTDVITEKTIDFIKSRNPNQPFAVLYYHKAPHRNWMPAQRHLGMYNDVTFPEPATLFDQYETRGRAAKEQEMEIGKHMFPDWDLKIATRDQLDPTLQVNHAGDVNKQDVGRANRSELGLEQFAAAYNRMTEEEKNHWDQAYKQRIEEFKSHSMSEKELVSWKYQQYMRDYLATVAAVDENVGRLMKYLETIGELDNTIIVYTSDQGFFLGEHGWFDKRFMYEECQRTPLLIRYPKKIKGNTTSQALCMNIDFASTFLDLVGLSVPDEIQGRSLVPILDGGGKTPDDWRKAVYYHYYEYPSWHSVKRHYGIRTDQYKLIHFYNDVDEWELYDMQEDSLELNNLYGRPGFETLQEQLKKQLKELQVEYHDSDPDEIHSQSFVKE